MSDDDLDLEELEVEEPDEDEPEAEEPPVAARQRRSGGRSGGRSGNGNGGNGGQAPSRRRSRRRSGDSSGSSGDDKPSDTSSSSSSSSSRSRSSRSKSDDERSRDDRPPSRRQRSSRSGGNGKPAADSASKPSPEPPTFEMFSSEREPAREEIVGPERKESVNDERKIALFCDLENIALGVRDSKEVNKFDINLVLERLLEKGKIIVKKSYCDWERYSEYKRPFHEAAIELIDIPQRHYSGKNSADIKMVVDAMDMSYAKEHLDTFVMLSGDSDFSPLVSKLKENNKYVIGVGVKGSSSNLLIDNCDEFIYYEDIWRDLQKGPQIEGLSKKQGELFGLLADAIQALVRENKDVLWGSMVKQTMQRKKPSFNESYYGYSSFSDLLEDAEEQGLLKIKKDQRSGSYIITGFAGKGKGRARRGR